MSDYADETVLAILAAGRKADAATFKYMFSRELRSLSHFSNGGMYFTAEQLTKLIAILESIK